MKDWQCSTCRKNFVTEEGCARHIEETHTKSGKGGTPKKVDNSPDYSDAAFSAGPHVYG